MTNPDLPVLPDPDDMDDDYDDDDAPGLDLGALLGGLGGAGGLGGLLDQAQQMMAAAAAAADATVEGTSGGGAVKVVVNGRMEFSSVSISLAVVDPADIGMLEDLVLAALRDATAKLAAAAPDASGLGDLGSLFGGA